MIVRIRVAEADLIVADETARKPPALIEVGAQQHRCHGAYRGIGSRCRGTETWSADDRNRSRGRGERQQARRAAPAVPAVEGRCRLNYPSSLSGEHTCCKGGRVHCSASLLVRSGRLSARSRVSVGSLARVEIAPPRPPRPECCQQCTEHLPAVPHEGPPTMVLGVLGEVPGVLLGVPEHGYAGAQSRSLSFFVFGPPCAAARGSPRGQLQPTVSPMSVTR